MVLEMVPVEAWPWMLVAFFIGFSGKQAVAHFHGVLLATSDAKDDYEDVRGNDVTPDDDEENEE